MENPPWFWSKTTFGGFLRKTHNFGTKNHLWWFFWEKPFASGHPLRYAVVFDPSKSAQKRALRAFSTISDIFGKTHLKNSLWERAPASLRWWISPFSVKFAVFGKTLLVLAWVYDIFAKISHFDQKWQENRVFHAFRKNNGKTIYEFWIFMEFWLRQNSGPKSRLSAPGRTKSRLLSEKSPKWRLLSPFWRKRLVALLFYLGFWTVLPKRRKRSKLPEMLRNRPLRDTPFGGVPKVAISGHFWHFLAFSPKLPKIPHKLAGWLPELSKMSENGCFQHPFSGIFRPKVPYWQ